MLRSVVESWLLGRSGSGHNLDLDMILILARVFTPLVHLLTLNQLSIFPAYLSPLSEYPVAAPYPVRLWFAPGVLGPLVDA